MNNEKVLFAYDYALKMSYKFQTVRYLKEDLVHDLILYILENPERLEEMTYIKSFVYRHLKWNRSNFQQRLKNKRVFNIIDKPIDILEGESSYLDSTDCGQLQSIEDLIDLTYTKEFLKTLKQPSKSIIGRGKHSRGQGQQIFDFLIEGFNSAEISEKLNISQRAVNKSISSTRKKLNNYFRK